MLGITRFLALFAVSLTAQIWDGIDPGIPSIRPQYIISAEAYYKLPVRTIWKTYPVYHPDKAPPDYIEWLRSQAPEQIANPTGEELYEAPMVIGSIGARPPSDPPYLHDKAWFDKVNPPLTREGSITGFVYVIRTKGKVEIATRSCTMCHNRVMPNGAVIRGGQGNFPVDAAFAEDLLTTTGIPALRDANKDLIRRLYGITADFNVATAAKLFTGRPPGVITPPGASIAYPVTIPNITGQTDPVRLARYLALKQLDYDPQSRLSDENLEKLAKYVIALKPPASPVKIDKVVKQGERVFEREGCGQCHAATPKWTPAAGFKPPPEHLSKYDIVPTSAGTDPRQALEAPRGTGYYKVPSLKGIWYRSALEHSGAIISLEEWLSSTRLSYYKGHEYGFNLNGSDRFALIAYLRTL